ncbi:hypothetical protein LC593_10845 [Nostoc sp. CHAB 5844]|nr:hypothetical protein [Nostoc sp. CHAB 5844]
MSESKKLTLTEIMARPMPEINEETQAEIDALESLFPQDAPEEHKPNESRLSKEISAWIQGNS